MIVCGTLVIGGTKISKLNWDKNVVPPTKENEWQKTARTEIHSIYDKNPSYIENDTLTTVTHIDNRSVGFQQN